MGMLDEQETIDAFGIPEYFVTQIRTEVVGSNVRMICGVRRGGATHWLYSCIVPAEKLIPITRQCADAAEAVFTREPLLQLAH